MHSPNPTAVVTGASSGIGLAIARALIAQGWNVVANARTESRLAHAAETLAGGERLLCVAGDVALPDTAKTIFGQAIERFGAVDMLVNNAGVFLPKPFVEFTEAELDQQIGINLKGAFYLSQEAVRHMKERGRGHIVNITAAVALKPHSEVPALLAALLKGGWNAATPALALELAPYGVRVNAVAPGIVDSPMHSPDTHEWLKRLQPVRRLGRVEEIAQAVLYLASAEFTNGIVLPVDGGATAGNC